MIQTTLIDVHTWVNNIWYFGYYAKIFPASVNCRNSVNYLMYYVHKACVRTMNRAVWALCKQEAKYITEDINEYDFKTFFK